jgi:hypothetical protein
MYVFVNLRFLWMARCFVVLLFPSTCAALDFVRVILITHSYFMTTKELVSYLSQELRKDLDLVLTDARVRSAKMKILSAFKRLLNWIDDPTQAESVR